MNPVKIAALLALAAMSAACTGAATSPSEETTSTVAVAHTQVVQLPAGPRHVIVTIPVHATSVAVEVLTGGIPYGFSVDQAAGGVRTLDDVAVPAGPPVEIPIKPGMTDLVLFNGGSQGPGTAQLVWIES